MLEEEIFHHQEQENFQGELPEKKPVEVDSAQAEFLRDVQARMQKAHKLANEDRKKLFDEANLESPVLWRKEVYPHQTLHDVRGYASRIRQFSWRLNGVKDTRELAPLVGYLERLPDTLHERVVVSKNKEEKIIAKMVAKGYVHDERMADTERDDGKVELNFTKLTTFEVNDPKEAKKLQDLLYGANDPIETIERLKNLGFSIDGHTIDYNLSELVAFTDSPAIGECLKKLEALGFRSDKKYFSGNEESVQDIKKFADEEIEANILTDENIKRMRAFEDIIGAPLPLDTSLIKEIKDFSEDEEAMEVARFICNQGVSQNFRLKGKDLAYALFAVRKSGLFEDISKMMKKDPRFAVAIIQPVFFYYNYHDSLYYDRDVFDKDTIEERVTAVRNFINSERYTTCVSDERFFNFASDASYLTDLGYYPIISDKSFRKLYQYPEALALMGVFKELHIDVGIDVLEAILRDKKRLEAMLSPEFIDFLNRYNQIFGNTEFIRLSSSRDVDTFLGDKEMRESLVSGETVAIINELGLGNYRLDRARAFIEIARLPGSLDTIKRLKSVYNFKDRSYGLGKIKELCESPELQQMLLDQENAVFIRLVMDSGGYEVERMIDKRVASLMNDKGKRDMYFSKETQDFYRNIRDAFHFAYNIDEYNELLSLQRENVLADKETNDFLLDATTGIGGLKDLRDFIALQPLQRELIKKLRNDFGYKFFPSEIYPSGNGFMSRMFHSEKLRNILERKDEAEYREFLSQEICTEFLYYGDPGHDYLEKIKERQWITIQTYNRLYAARRAYIGFRSYAYKPREEGAHPIINTTFYRNSLQEIISKQSDGLQVTKEEDEKGFYPGSIGGAPIRIYPETYQLYEHAIKKYRDRGETFVKIPSDFTWYEAFRPIRSTNDKKKEEGERIMNQAIPLGVALNGHTHYYATPYGIVSGCVAVSPSESGIFEAEHVASKAIGIVTGHREMLNDFFSKEEGIASALEEQSTDEVIKNGIKINIEEIDLPQELNMMVAPGNITLREVLVNLHIEQYLHPIRRDMDLVEKIVKQIESDNIEVFFENKQLSLADVVPGGSKLFFKTKEDTQRMAA